MGATQETKQKNGIGKPHGYLFAQRRASPAAAGQEG
jgi:hypothetical protein